MRCCCVIFAHLHKGPSYLFTSPFVHIWWRIQWGDEWRKHCECCKTFTVREFLLSIIQTFIHFNHYTSHKLTFKYMNWYFRFVRWLNDHFLPERRSSGWLQLVSVTFVVIVACYKAHREGFSFSSLRSRNDPVVLVFHKHWGRWAPDACSPRKLWTLSAASVHVVTLSVSVREEHTPSTGFSAGFRRGFAPPGRSRERLHRQDMQLKYAAEFPHIREVSTNFSWT